MNKQELIKKVADTTNSTLVKTEDIINAMLYIIAMELKDGDYVKLTSFGKFDIFERHARNVRIPGSGEIMKTPPTRVVKFRPSEVLKKIVKF